MGPVNWVAVFLAATLATAVGLAWNGLLFRTGPQLIPGNAQGSRGSGVVTAVMLLGAIMLGHNFARLGAETLGAKP